MMIREEEVVPVVVVEEKKKLILQSACILHSDQNSKILTHRSEQICSMLKFHNIATLLTASLLLNEIQAFQPISVAARNSVQLRAAYQYPAITGTNGRFDHPMYRGKDSQMMNGNSLQKMGQNEQKSSSTALKSLNTAVLTASFSATAKLLSSIGVGALTTPAGPKTFGNILDGEAVSALSRLTYWLFQPCFLLCGVASTLGKACSGSGGLPTDALLLLPLAAMVQICLGAVAAKLLTTKKFGIRPMFLGIDTEDDAGASDIRMCTTFANSGPLPLILSDALFSGALLTDVAACVSFYLLVWSPLFWSFGKMILGLNDKEADSDDRGGVSKVVNKVRSLLSPPVIGSIMGIVIGSSSILRNLFLEPGALFAPLFGALRTFGVAYLPSAILVLAGSLVKKDTGEKSDSKATSVHPKTIISLLFSRFILSPALALATVRLLSIANLLPVDNARTLAIVTFTLLMEGCMPPAQNSVIMLQLAQEKGRASKMAKLLTVMYALSAIPVTLLLSGCLGISGILNFA